MTYPHNEEWRMRILLSFAWQENQPIIKHTPNGEIFSVFTFSLEREGLIQVTHEPSQLDGPDHIFRFNRFGQLKGIFDRHRNGQECLRFDLVSGFGRASRHQFEQETTALIGRLEATMTEEETYSFYL